MKHGRFIYLLTVVFVLITLLVVYMQYNANRNIRGLISGNERLLNEFSYDKDLRNIQSKILNIESKVRGVIVTGNLTHREGINEEIDRIGTIVDRLQQIRGRDSTEMLVDQLDRLLKRKVELSRGILGTYVVSGKQAAEALSGQPESKNLTDSISTTIQQLEAARREALSEITLRLDDNGRKAWLWGYVFLIFTLLMSISAFVFIVNRIKRQQELIRALDASEKKEREAARIKENFLANMSHEIRTPLNAIMGFTRLLRRRTLDPGSEEYVRSIERSGDSLMAIVNDILDLSRIEAGMMRIEPTPFNIRQLIQSVVTMFESRASEKQLTLQTQVGDEVPEVLVQDNTRITQILVNLTGNAVKFTPSGGITIKANGKMTGDGKFLLQLEVADTGIGISPEKLSVIFNRFEQAEASTTRTHGGTGLGLAIVQELATLLGGTVSAQSEEGRGSVFTCSIPCSIATSAAVIPGRKETAAISPTDFSGLRVLVVEDHEINQRLLGHLFDEWKLAHVLVSNGNEALEQLQKEQFSMVLMDIQMPEMDGYATTREIRNTLGLDVPVIAMTAHAMAGEREKCIRYGMNDHLAKPVREAELIGLIQQYARPLHMKGQQKTEPRYQVINLAYMKEVSHGDTGYEKTVTEQFLEMMPEEMRQLRAAFDAQDINRMKRTAHNMKTTISVMGLGERLDPLLDALEQAHQGGTEQAAKISRVESIGAEALREARNLYQDLSL